VDEGDEYLLDTPTVRDFIAGARATIAGADSPAAACEAIRPAFAELLADPGWLPERYQEGDPESGMGGGIGQWLLFRAGDRALTLFSLVVPPGAATPIHDHLAWGLVGLYRGTQDEEIYGTVDGRAELRERRALGTGDFYALLPPRDDVHRVRTTSSETSVSIHLLTNDTGCVWRHAYDEQSGAPEPFRSGYVNLACETGTVDLVREWFAAFNRRDIEATLEMSHPEIAFRPLQLHGTKTWRGREGVATLWARMFEVGLDHRIDITDIRELADGHVAALGIVRPGGEGFAGIYRVEDGLVRSAQHTFADDETLRRLGLR
jgi:3-mercaptopropionate dioxygenase